MTEEVVAKLAASIEVRAEALEATMSQRGADAQSDGVDKEEQAQQLRSQSSELAREIAETVSLDLLRRRFKAFREEVRHFESQLKSESIDPAHDEAERVVEQLERTAGTVKGALDRLEQQALRSAELEQLRDRYASLVGNCRNSIDLRNRSLKAIALGCQAQLVRLTALSKRGSK